MPKPPLDERIKALEQQNAQIADKISRMKAQMKHNSEVIRKLKRREDKQDVAALMDELQRNRQEDMNRRSEQSERDKRRAKDAKAAKYREEMERRLRQCRIMNGLEPDDD